MAHLLIILSILLTLTSNGWAAPPAATVRVDSVLAVVADAVVTESDVRLHKAMSVRDPSPIPCLSPTTATAATAAQDAISATIIRALAGRVSVYQPGTSDVRARTTRFQAQWTNPAEYNAFLQTHGLNQERLQQTLKRRMIIERVVQRNIGLASENTDPQQWSEQYSTWLNKERAELRIRTIQIEKTP